MTPFVLAAAFAASLLFPSPAAAQDETTFSNALVRVVTSDAKLKTDEDLQADIVGQARLYAPYYQRLIRERDPKKRQEIYHEIEQNLPNGRDVSRLVGQVIRMNAPTVTDEGKPGGTTNPDPSGNGSTPTKKDETTNGGGGSSGVDVSRPSSGGRGSSVNEIPNIPPDRRRAGADAAVYLNPDDSGARFDHAVIYFRTGDAQTAFNDTTAALALGKRDAKTLTLNAQAAAKLGDYELAHQQAGEALKMDPDDRTAGIVFELTRNRASRVNLGAALAKTGVEAAPNLQAAAAALEGQGLPAGAPGAAAAGVSAAGAGDARSQVTAAELAAIASQKANVPASRERQSSALTREAQARITLKDYDAARVVASQAIDLNPNNAQAWTYRAIANTALNKLSDAVYDASYAIKLVPGNAPALQTRSWAFNKQKLYKESLADATATIEQNPGNAEAYFNASWAYAGLGQRPRAMEALEQAAKRSKRFEPVYQAAIQAPENADLLLLFQDQAPERPLPEPGSPKRRLLRFILISLSGGLLIALAVLHVVSASWRERVNETVRRVLGGAADRGAVASSSQDLAGALPSGAQGIWSQYTPVSTLGQGGMGIVYEAVDKNLDRKVAVKKMRDEIRTDPGERQRFITEARLVAGLHHPNIVEIYSIVEDSQDVYLVFEHVAGATLADKLRDGPMSLEGARQVLAGACAAVTHAHKNNVIHRDLKPSNIMLSDTGEAKVMDFGVARQAKDAMTKMALTNTIVGTPPYMAPEQEQGSVRKESDVFALGVCFFEMLTGELPFAGVGAGMLLNKINGRHAKLSEKAPGVPQALDAVVAKALAGDPDKRYRTPAEFLAAVDQLVPARLA